MANQVKMAVREAIIAYSGLGWSRRRIARTLGINRETVARHLAESKPAIPPTGVDRSNPAILPAGISANSLLLPTGKTLRLGSG